MQSLLVYTDLDGTLINHDDYGVAEAMPVVNALAARKIPLLINTSKTFAEVLRWRERLHNSHPFITENGGAIFVPADSPLDLGLMAASPFASTGTGYYCCRLGPDYAQIRAVLDRLRGQYGFRFQGFLDLGVEGVRRATGLSRDDARMALERTCSEPLLWDDDDDRLQEFTRLLSQSQLRLVKGGRFYHVMGQTDKAQAMHVLNSCYQALWPDTRLQVIALGDNHNDRMMLEAADQAVVVMTPRQGHMQLKRKHRVIYTQKSGSAGWAQAMTTLLKIGSQSESNHE